MEHVLQAIQIVVWLVLILMPCTIVLAVGHHMSFRRAFAFAGCLLAAAIVVSIDDIAWPAGPCDELYTIVHEEQDPDGNTFWSIRVTKYMQDNGSDSMCQAFGQCVLDLIGSSPQMGAVEIVNPEDEWVPSKWRYIEVTKAMILAGEADEAEMYEYAYDVDYDD